MQKRSSFSSEPFRIPQKQLQLFGLWVLFVSQVLGCPITINPPRLVVKYGESASADCITSVPFEKFGWETSAGKKEMTAPNRITLTVSNMTTWKLFQPFCYITLENQAQCEQPLPITLYKTPDHVFSKIVGHTGPVMEGKTFELQCDIYNVAPVHLVTVNWYKEGTLLDQTNFTDTSKTPVDTVSKMIIQPNREDEGARFWCETQMNLGEGHQPPLTNTSNELILSVNYKPSINENKLSSVVSVIRGYPVELLCEAEGKPKPTIQWSNGIEMFVGENFTVTDSTPENLLCTATNSVGNATKTIQVIFTENNLPIIIACICGILVLILITSIIFYHIYYKKNRISQYDLRRPNAHYI